MYILKPESIQENETHEFLWDFMDTQFQLENLTKHQLTKKKCHLVDFVVPADHWVKIEESEKINKYLDLARELKKAVEYEDNTNCSFRT